jgi:engulfment/cell motility protein 1
MIRVTHRRKMTEVDPVMEPNHAAALAYIWTTSRLTEEQSEDGLYKWRKLGFNSEDLSREFSDVGVLGLECLVRLSEAVS